MSIDALLDKYCSDAAKAKQRCDTLKRELAAMTAANEVLVAEKHRRDLVIADLKRNLAELVADKKGQ